MNLGADKDRLLVAIGCALVIHVGVAVGLSFVDWHSTPERRPLYVELSDPALLDVPETELPDEPEPDPPPPEPEPEEVVEPPPAESEPEPSEDPPPTDQPEEPAPAEEPAPRDRAPAEEPAPAPEPAPTRRQGPTEEDVAEALGGMLGSGAERERRERAPAEPSPTTDDGEIAQHAEEMWRQYRVARAEHEQALIEQQEYFDSREAAGESVDEAGDPETVVTPRIRDLIGRASDVPDRPSEPLSDAPASDDTEGTDDPGDGFVEWEGDGDRELVEYWLPEFDGSDLRAGGPPTIHARIRFEVDAQGTVRPASVDIQAPGLAPGGRQKLREAVSSWRFDSRPGAPVARGSVDFVFERTG